MADHDARPALAVVLGSATPPGRLHRALAEAVGRTGGRWAVDAALLDLATLPFSPADGRPPEDHGVELLGAVDAVAAADAVVLATPVYRGSLTGVLKNLLDHLPVEALRGDADGDRRDGGERPPLPGRRAPPSRRPGLLRGPCHPDGGLPDLGRLPRRRPRATGDRRAGRGIDAVLELERRLREAAPLGPAPLAGRPRGAPA
jgi:hypothetical protein